VSVERQQKSGPEGLLVDRGSAVRSLSGQRAAIYEKPGRQTLRAGIARPAAGPFVALALAAAVGLALLTSCSRGPAAAAAPAASDTAPEAASAPGIATPAPPPGGRFPTTIHRAYTELGMLTDKRDARGKPLRVPCLTCHEALPLQPQNRRKKKLTAFHTEVVVSHGGQSCGTCHAEEPRDRFNLADGTLVAYEDVMALCGQCHASRLAEYKRGAHGGMSGYWDTTRGPRTKNHCLDCHNAHAPAIPKVIPAERLRYRTGH